MWAHTRRAERGKAEERKYEEIVVIPPLLQYKGGYVERQRRTKILAFNLWKKKKKKKK